MSWNPIDTPVDKVIFAGRPSPGLADVVGADSPRDWDERRGYGLSGATLFFRGVKLSHFSVKLRLYTVQDWVDWYAFKPIVDKPPLGKRPRAIDISHPFLEDLGIRAVEVENVGAPEQTDHGEFTVELKLIEYRRPKFTMSKPEGAEATPVDPVEQEIAKNSAEIAALADQ